jgi:ketosteroid isomerase-like protein
MTPTTPDSGSDHIDLLIEKTAEAANAWMRGDMTRYLDLIHHAPGYTLTAPTGGPPVQHADRRSELGGWQSPFADGEATLEVTAAHSWGDTAVLVMIERQHGKLGDQPDQDLSLRVTEVHRWTGAGWVLVHRHADPLTRHLSMDQLTSLTDT